jgi:hypothetical protein
MDANGKQGANNPIRRRRKRQWSCLQGTRIPAELVGNVPEAKARDDRFGMRDGKVLAVNAWKNRISRASRWAPTARFLLSDHTKIDI